MGPVLKPRRTASPKEPPHEPADPRGGRHAGRQAFALNQGGGAHWKKRKAAIEKALLPHQRKDGNFLGSWDPGGPWGEEGGRVYSTAISALILEVYYRYSRVLGAR